MRILPFRLEHAGLIALFVVACGSTEATTPGDAGGGPQPGPDASVDPDAAGSPGVFNPVPDSGGPGLGMDATTGGPALAIDASTSAPDGTAPGAGSTDASAGGTDSGNGLEVDSRAAYCSGLGPPVTVGDNRAGRDVCTGALAEWAFSHALCTCNDATTAGVLVTDAFDSSQGPYTAGQGGAPVGVDRTLTTAGVPSIGGSLNVAGPGGLTFAGSASIFG